MAKDSRNESTNEGTRAGEATSLETLIRRRARGLIDAIVEEELEAALGAAPSVRVGSARLGYRHGARDRTLTTSLGPTTFAMPRARVRSADGETTEWRSELVPRYQRRSERVDEAILGVYLSGTNTRRIKGALAPLLRGGPLSKDAVSRLVGRLADDFETWRRRDLAEDQIQYLSRPRRRCAQPGRSSLRTSRWCSPRSRPTGRGSSPSVGANGSGSRTAIRR